MNAHHHASLRHVLGSHVHLVGIAVLAAASSALAQSWASLETWVDPIEIMDAPVNRLLDSDVALISKAHMTRLSDGSFLLDTECFTHLREDPSVQFCPGTRFYGQPHPGGAGAGRSGVLVGRDLVLTAGHSVPTSPKAQTAFCRDGWYFVFDYRLEAPVDSCAGPGYIILPAENVYECAEIVRAGMPATDLALIRLDRPVEPWRHPLRIRRSGTPDIGANAVMMGHPQSLPVKIDIAAQFLGQAINGAQINRGYSGLHVLDGSSGSVVFNTDDQLAEAIVCCGQGVAVAQTAEQCYQLTHVNSTSIGGTVGVESFAAIIPPFSLTVGSLDRVTHTRTASGAMTHPVTRYTLTLPTTAQPTAITVEVDDPQPAAPGTHLTAALVMPADHKDGLLHPGETAFLDVTAYVVGDPPSGIHQRSVRVTDGTFRFVDTLKHDFQFGSTGFSLSPLTPFTVSDPLPPVDETRQYTIRNTKNIPVSVQVTTGADWLTLDGQGPRAPSLGLTRSYTLAPMGSIGDSASFVVGIGGFAGALAPGRYQSVISVRNVSDNPVDEGNFQIPVDLQYGVQTFASDDTPLEVPDGDPVGIESSISAADIPIFDLAVEIDLEAVGFQLDDVNAADLKIELISPQGTAITLWDHNPPPFIGLFDDLLNRPPTGERLCRFDGQSSGGDWVLRVVDDEPSKPTSSPILTSWTFSVFGGVSGRPCE